jgi:hypothetical protein
VTPGETYDTCSPINRHPTCIKLNGESGTTTEDETPPCLGELSKLPCVFPYVLDNVTLKACTAANNLNGRLPERTWCPLLVEENSEPRGQPGTSPLYEGTLSSS